jgi:uncharacterized membrane protein
VFERGWTGETIPSEEYDAIIADCSAAQGITGDYAGEPWYVQLAGISQFGSFDQRAWVAIAKVSNPAVVQYIYCGYVIRNLRPSLPRTSAGAVGPYADVEGYSDIYLAGHCWLTAGEFSVPTTGEWNFVWEETVGVTVFGSNNTAGFNSKHTAGEVAMDETGAIYFVDFSATPPTIALKKRVKATGVITTLSSDLSDIKAPEALYCSTDGNAVAFYSERASPLTGYSTWFWSSITGMVEIMPEEGTYEVHLTGMAANGSVVYGYVMSNPTPSTYAYESFVWEAATETLTLLPTLGGTDSWGTRALASTSDGSVIYGRAKDADGVFRFFEWTAADGISDLLGESFSYEYPSAIACSSDGLTRYCVTGPATIHLSVEGSTPTLIFTSTDYINISPLTINCSRDGATAVFTEVVSGVYTTYKYTEGAVVELENTIYPTAPVAAPSAVSPDCDIVCGYFSDTLSQYTLPTSIAWVQGGHLVLGDFRPLADLEGSFFDFAQSIL